MPIITPYVPSYIVVHLGTPNSSAQNVTVSFPDYIKNVASSEIYPTWNEAAIYANIYAQISFALNRIYLEHYPSQGYSFNITIRLLLPAEIFLKISIESLMMFLTTTFAEWAMLNHLRQFIATELLQLAMDCHNGAARNLQIKDTVLLIF